MAATREQYSINTEKKQVVSHAYSRARYRVASSRQHYKEQIPRKKAAARQHYSIIILLECYMQCLSSCYSGTSLFRTSDLRSC